MLFLDEFAQIPKSVSEALRGPLEDRKVTISRYYGEEDRCTCTVGQRQAYLGRLSGPIMVRIDVQLWMHPVEASKLVEKPKGETSAMVAARVLKARKIQQNRFKGLGIHTNSEMNNRQMNVFCRLDTECKETMERLIGRMGLSARAFSRVIKLARTIADLAGVPDIRISDLLEAASYRFLDKTRPHHR